MTPQTVHNHLRAILRTDDIVAARVHAAWAISELTGANAYALLSEAAQEREADSAAVALDNAAHESAVRHSYGALEDHNAHVAAFKAAARGEQCEIESTAAAEGFASGRLFRHVHGGSVPVVMPATMAPESIEMPAESDGISARRAS